MSDPFMTLKFAQGLSQKPSPLDIFSQGMTEAAMIHRNTQQQKEQQQAYQSSFQRYMNDPTPENKATLMQAAQVSGNFDETASTIGAVEEQRAAAAEAARMAQLNSDYQSAMAEYTVDNSPENRREVMELGSRLGRFDDITAQLDAYDEGQLQGLVKNNVAILAAMENQMPSAAKDEIERQLATLDSAGLGDSDRAEDLDHYLELIEDGNLSAAQRHLELTTAATGDFGSSALDNMWNMRQDEREEREHYANIITRLVDTEIKDEERRAEVKEQAMKLPNPELAELYVDMLSTVDKFGDGSEITENQIMNARLAWRQQYLDEIAPFKKIGEQTSIVRQAAWTALGAEGLEADTEGNRPAQGVADLALVNAFQRLIDDATVRESDITNLKSTIGTVEQMKTMFAGWQKGDILSPLQRRAMLNMSEQIRGVFEEQEATTREVIGQNISDLNTRWNDPTALTDESIMGEPLFQQTQDRLEDEVRDALVGVWPAEKQRIMGMDWEELQARYSRTLGLMGALSGGPPPVEEVTGTGEAEEWD